MKLHDIIGISWVFSILFFTSTCNSDFSHTTSYKPKKQFSTRITTIDRHKDKPGTTKEEEQEKEETNWEWTCR